MRLEDAVQAALSRLQREGIEGWGLYLRSAELEWLGELVQVGPRRGCTSARCGHVSHDPAAPRRRWIPRAGALYYLGRAGDGDYGYYVLRLPGRDIFLRFRPPGAFHAWIDIVDHSRVPEYLLARLAGIARHSGGFL